VINDDILNVLRTLNDESAQIVIADPPYNIGKDFGNKSDKQPMDEYLRWCDEWIEGCLRVLRNDGTMFIYGFSEILALILARIPQDVNRRWLVWHYTNKTVPKLNFGKGPTRVSLFCGKVTRCFTGTMLESPIRMAS
jgi:site-specific DNA-methyltransferase (adenine-specific)